ncbi:GHMP family kinase ATP-binding protein [Hydrogenothermus marinus]|uniref:D-glycero-alpha-D-manno-heptose-7-phosphate kinase n=1 Tax=Hydrogenothermus marinus TaxID=133270 RepID=A0A3M0BQW2_9AQUI|nr:dehydrogenase [Hydrogenothermus marinus]RMA93312.1 D-glycero-alpha-D-manno-heptose-7-phosphate kinase [Hydrogenothermus marinus]
MLIRSKAPLRLGLAGGGTDVSPYADMYGGAVLNATISMYAYASIEPRDDGKIVFNSVDRSESLEFAETLEIEIDGKLDLLKGIYNRIVKDFTKEPLSFELTTYVDAPPGSGLGSSSTLVVAIIGAFVEWLKLPLGEYDISHLAYEIERKDLGMAGGKQDQYAATFGGFNFMEFYDNDRVIVNPLRIKPEIVNELQFNLLLYYTGTSRLSSKIIEAQVKNVKQKRTKSIEAMHKLKEQSILMKEAILKGELDKIGEILDFGWQYKKQMASSITNPLIEEIYETAKKAGAIGGKISGAGGGGFMMLYCPGNSRYKVIEALKKFGGEFRRFQFTKYGLETWRV